MSQCNPNFDKYPYVYECCPDSIDGITSQFLIDLWKERDIEDYHIYCCHCRKIYHIFKLGMKWTEHLATDEQIKEYKEDHAKFMLRRDEEEVRKPETFNLSDIPKFICRVCKKGMFETEPLEIKEKFIEDMNMTVGMLFKLSAIITKEQYIEEWNITKLGINSCRRCTEIAKHRMDVGRYN